MSTEVLSKSKTFPRYTQYEISELVNSKIEMGLAVESLCGEDLITLTQILEKKVSFKIKHYKLAAQILELSEEELLAEVHYDNEVYCRSTIENNSELSVFVEKVESLFGEWINQKKIAGSIS